eukprot:TRINITY_DN96730_c0_g1_i1.p1 TRINITY_DN96730_c0_g1~~TRINITY_DN96730_c0_g1_i1.p1  ORF type:complete len:109 (-),score=9.18 TRINITY_DN96730_c0_g1_i1:61-387(-)
MALIRAAMGVGQAKPPAAQSRHTDFVCLCERRTAEWSSISQELSADILARRSDSGRMANTSIYPDVMTMPEEIIFGNRRYRAQYDERDVSCRACCALDATKIKEALRV